MQAEARLGYINVERPLTGRDRGNSRALIRSVSIGALHIHIVLGTRDGSAMAGHLGAAHVRPTLEVIVTESAAHLRKVKDAETGLALIRPAA